MNSLGISPVSHRPPPFQFPSPPSSSSASEIPPPLSSPRYIASASQSCPPVNLLEEHFTRPTPPASPPRRNTNPVTIANGSALDSMSLHLLVETAIYDSSEYEVLPYEQLDSLKKEYANLINRIENAKRRLQMESKVRDAAMSLTRLYSGKKTNRRSLLSGRESGHSREGSSDQGKSTEMELMESTRKCEDISRELWRLNNRAIEIQKRLLQHSAAVLGMAQQMQQTGEGKGMDAGSWDERSAYRTPENLMRGLSISGPSAPSIGEGVIERIQDLSDAFSAAMGRRPKMSPGKQDLNELLSELEQGVEYLRTHPPGDPETARELQQAETTMRSLWDMIALDDYDPSVQSDDDFDRSLLSFSVDTFTHKVQSLLERYQEARETTQKQQEEVAVLMRQLEQQRTKEHRKTLEVNATLSKSSNELSDAIAAKEAAEAELEAARQLVERERLARELAEQQADALLADKAAAMDELQLLRESRDAVEGQLDAVISETDTRLRHLENEIKNIKAAKQTSDNSNTTLSSQLSEAQLQLDERTSALEHMTLEREKTAAELKRTNTELEELSQKLAEVSTELVMAKAELDASYGSKSQRAAETAEVRAAAEALAKASQQPQTIDPGLLAEIDTLATRNRELEKELKALLADFEEVTKQGVELERERTKVDQLLDALRDRVEELETALGEERIRSLGGRPASGADGGRVVRGPADSTSMSVLKQEFKKMMRDMRAEQQKALKASPLLPHTHPPAGD